MIPPSDTEPAQVPAPALATTVMPRKILLVEDGYFSQRATLAMLRHGDHVVTVANNGREALAQIAAQAFDAILMDVQMPEMNGLRATREIRRREQGTAAHVLIIGVSAEALTIDRRQCLAAGMDDFLAKPFSADQLFARLESLPPDMRESSGDRTSGGDRPAVGLGSSAGAATMDAAVFDYAAALARFQHDHAILNALVNDFLSQLPVLATQIAESCQDRDAPALRRAAQYARGSADALCARRVARLSHELELLARQGACQAAETLIAELDGELRHLVAALTQASETARARGDLDPQPPAADH